MELAKTLEQFARDQGWTDQDLLDACNVMLLAAEIAMEKHAKDCPKNPDKDSMN